MDALPLCDNAMPIARYSERRLQTVSFTNTGRDRVVPQALIHRAFSYISPRFRRRRMAAFVDRFSLTPQMTVLDVGGTTHNWNLSPVRPCLTLLNLPGKCPGDEHATCIEGDARCLPFGDGAFDVAYSNSVIEHVGNAGDQARFAVEIRRVGRSYSVQTPNRWFPIEPHYLTPFVHWLPKSVRARMLRNFTVWGWLTRPTPEQCRTMVDEIRLLTKDEMQRLFPDAEIVAERFLGLPKSFTAIKRPTGD